MTSERFVYNLEDPNEPSLDQLLQMLRDLHTVMTHQMDENGEPFSAANPDLFSEVGEFMDFVSACSHASGEITLRIVPQKRPPMVDPKIGLGSREVAIPGLGGGAQYPRPDAYAPPTPLLPPIEGGVGAYHRGQANDLRQAQAADDRWVRERFVNPYPPGHPRHADLAGTWQLNPPPGMVAANGGGGGANLVPPPFEYRIYDDPAMAPPPMTAGQAYEREAMRARAARTPRPATPANADHITPEEVEFVNSLRRGGQHQQADAVLDRIARRVQATRVPGATVIQRTPYVPAPLQVPVQWERPTPLEVRPDAQGNAGRVNDQCNCSLCEQSRHEYQALQRARAGTPAALTQLEALMERFLNDRGGPATNGGGQ